MSEGSVIETISFGIKPTGVLQSDYTITNNGYGLLQLTAKFIFDSTDVNTIGAWKRGMNGIPYAETGTPQLYSEAINSSDRANFTLIRGEENGTNGNLTTFTLYYAGIAKEVGGETTETEATITSAAVSEPIESHPNFSIRQIEKIGADGEKKPLGGVLDSNGPPLDVNDNARNPYRAKWIPSSTGGTTSYQFVAFLPTQDPTQKVNRKAGVKSWFRPSINMKLVAYTTNEKLAGETIKYVGWITDTGVGAVTIPEAYQAIKDDGLKITGPTADPSTLKGKNWLITGSNMEVFGGLYKVTVDLMLSGPAGWDTDIYPKYTAPAAGS